MYLKFNLKNSVLFMTVCFALIRSLLILLMELTVNSIARHARYGDSSLICCLTAHNWDFCTKYLEITG